MNMEFEEMKKIIETGNFAILSASTQKIKGTPEEESKTKELVQDITSVGYKVTEVFGRYKYEDGTLAKEPSIFISDPYLEEKYFLKLDEKFIKSLLKNMNKKVIYLEWN